MVEHDALKARLRREFDRLNIGDNVRDALTVELNRLAELLIESYEE